MTVPRPLKLIYVEWDDASSRAAWMVEDELDGYGRSSHIVRQSGFLLEQTDRHLLLAGAVTVESKWSAELFGDVTRIPRTWIRRQRVLGTLSGGELVPAKRQTQT